MHSLPKRLPHVLPAAHEQITWDHPRVYDAMVMAVLEGTRGLQQDCTVHQRHFLFVQRLHRA